MRRSNIKQQTVFLDLLACVALLIAMVLPVSAQNVDREAAVKLARNGDYLAAIRQLQVLAKQSSDPLVRYDLITILDWAGRDSEVIRVWQDMGAPVDLPDYVRLSLVDALIAQQQWLQAKRVTQTWLKAEPDNVDAVFFMGQVLQATADRFGALQQYQIAQQLAPENQKIRAKVVGLLTELGAVSAAARQAQQPSADLKASLAAQQVRWGLQVPAATSKSYFVRLDAAILDLKQQIDEANRKTPDDLQLLRRLHADLAVALSDRQDFNGVLQQLTYLESTGGIPGYVRVIQGDALLASRRPEQAREVFERVLTEQPNNRLAQQGLLGTLIVLNEWQAAYALADRIEPNPRLQLPKSPVPYGNSAWLDARIQAALVRLWADQDRQAWELIEPLVSQAPAEPYLQIATAAIAKARSWPRLGEQHAQTAFNLSPQNKEAQIALGNAQMSRRQWGQARERLQNLQRDFPADVEIEQFAKDLGVQDMYELVINLQGEDESGQSFYAPGDGYQTSAYLYSPRLNDRWRLYSAATAGRARSPGLYTATRQQIGLGALIQWPDAELDVSVWQNFGSVHKTSVAASVSYSPDDHWQFNAGYSSFTTDMPLRALAYGVTANEWSLGAGYSFSSDLGIGFGYANQQFSDGNQRQRVLANASALVYSAPGLSWSVLPSIYASTNTEDSVEYFSPKQDLAINVGLQGERMIWQRYDQAFGDRLLVGAGNYWQENYGSGLIAEVIYQQFYRIDPLFEVNYGVGWNRRIYDGTPENTVQLFLNLVARF